VGLDRIKGWFRREAGKAEDVVEGAAVVATSPADVGSESIGPGDVERETSTNAQTQAAVDEPWPGSG
jgi:hypothetical protein